MLSVFSGLLTEVDDIKLLIWVELKGSVKSLISIILLTSDFFDSILIFPKLSSVLVAFVPSICSKLIL